MTETITEAELAELQKACDEASPAPWFQCGAPWGNGTMVHDRTMDPHGADRIICIGEDFDREEPPDGFRTVENMAFIALARNALPTLLAMVRELKRERDVLATGLRLVPREDILPHALKLPTAEYLHFREIIDTILSAPAAKEQ